VAKQEKKKIEQVEEILLRGDLFLFIFIVLGGDTL
jgi:hypothetical protein